MSAHGIAKPSNHLAAGCSSFAAGALVGVLIHFHPEKLNVPAWVGYASCLVLCFAGAALVAKGFERLRLTEVLVALTLGGMLVVGAWIAFGPGTRQCAAYGFHVGGWSPEWACRMAFGLGAAIVAGMLFLITGHLLRRRSARNPEP